MSSERRSIEGDLPDGVVPEGQEHNPNPADQVAANRARFEAKQRELQHDREEAAEQIRAIQHRLEDQYEQAMHDPAHQAFIPEQIAHEAQDPTHTHGGQEQTGAEYVAPAPSQDYETRRPSVLPTTPHAAEERRGE